MKSIKILLLLSQLSSATIAKTGFILKMSKDDTILSMLGLKNGDKVIKLNDNEVKSQEVFNKLDTPLKSITIIRDGKTQTLKFDKKESFDLKTDFDKK